MAIEINSKTKIKSSAWAIILGALCLVLLLASVASYFYLNILTEKIKKEIQDKEKALIATSSEKALENNLNLVKNKINKFSDLLLEHHNSVNVLTSLEHICIPNVQFLDFTFDSRKNTVSISGKTDGFMRLGQQIDILERESLIKAIKVSNILMGEEGEVNFSFLLTLDTRIFNLTEIASQ